MEYWRSVWNIIKGNKTSTWRGADGYARIKDGFHFHSMSLNAHEEVVSIVENEQRGLIEKRLGKSLISTDDVQKQSIQALAPLRGYAAKGIGSGNELVGRVLDSFSGANFNAAAGMMPNGYNLNTAPQFGGMTEPNLWIDPGKAAVIYAEGGLGTLAINRKCKPIAYHGVKIVNPELSAEQMERVNESAEKTGFARALANGARDGLTYGGSIVFPMFKKDIPATLLMDIGMLAKLDVVGKDCIARYVTLDRNNAIHIPNWNPTAEDFLNPRFYFIPYLGCDVAGQRLARIVPLPQAGYWGAIMTMGWGVSDIQNWYRAKCNYEGVADALPRMISQMSILVRTFNVDLSNALNGAVGLKDMDLDDMETIRMASNENPITMDVIGDLKAIERDFTAVAELTRIVRQDFSMRTNMPEESFWSSDRGAFSSGDQSDGVNERQWEGMKYIHGEIEDRCRNLAMLEVINALGKDRDIRRALAATRVQILPPRIENAEKRAKVVKDLSEGTFNLVASGMKLAAAIDIVMPYGDMHLAPKAEVIAKIAEYQKEIDKREEEDHRLDAELKQKQIDAPVSAPGTPSSSAPKPKGEEKGYSKLEQRMHEKTRGASARREGLQKAQGKKL